MPVGGLIPAHAGKTLVGQARIELATAHPRSRGENLVRQRHTYPLMGSSPLTRGKRRPRELVLGVPGLIPAHAGKTHSWRGRRARPGAHPRSRGENYNDAPHALAVEGSSPLTRGKPGGPRPAREREGLIPAHAGKTDRGEALGSWIGAHPRSRGENESGRSGTSSLLGSSPLTRGKHEEGRR